jgi:hypothetical protein
MTPTALGLAAICEWNHHQIVELARAGERNLLCEGALKKLAGALFGD